MEQTNPTLDFDVLACLTEEEREKAERAKKKPARELSEEEKEILRRLREEREAKRNFKATLRAISVRMPLMLYGADGNWDEDISLDRFVELVDESVYRVFGERTGRYRLQPEGYCSNPPCEEPNKSRLKLH